MAASEGSRTPGPRPEAVLELVLDVVRALARETGGPRAERAVSPEASLEREVGLGSLERVELVARLERAFGRALDDRCLAARHARPASPAPSGRVLPGQALSLPAREEALGVAADIGAGVRTLHESLWRHAHLDPGARPRLPARRPGSAPPGGAAPAAASESEEPITYGRLRDEAAAVAGGLRERGVARGDTVALMLPTGLDFLRSFFGILLARAVPVPIYPPVRLDRLEEYAARQSAILADAGVRLLVTIPRARPVVEPAEAGGADARRRGDRRRARGLGRAGLRPRGRRRRPGLHPVHLGQHRPAQGRPAHPRQPARQRPRDRRRASRCAPPTSE